MPSSAASPRVGPESATPRIEEVPPSQPAPKLVLKPLRDPSVAPATPATVKQKAVPSWAKSGLTSQEKKMIEAILKRVTAHPSAIWFLHPVDPVRHNAPTYFDVIKHPMDLSTVASKLKSGQYGNRQQFADDFKLILSNAYLFNPPGTDPHNDALKIEEFFDKMWKTTDDAVEKDKARVKLPPRIVAPPSATPAPVPVPTVQPLPPPPASGKEPDLEQELLAAADIPGDDEDAPFDEDVDALLLGSTSTSIPEAPKIKVKARRPAPDLDFDEADDLEAALLDAADASSSRKVSEPPRKATPQSDTHVVPHPKFKVSLGSSHVRSTTPSTTPPQPYVSTTPATEYTRPAPRPETSYATAGGSTPDHSSSSRKRAVDVDDASQVPIDPAKCKALLQKLADVPHGWIFLNPVNSTLPGLETYYEEIKHPMDYSTMRRKLDKKQYATMEDFADDLRLVYANGRQFNAAAPDILDLIDTIEALWKKEWPSMLKRKMPAELKRQLAQALNQLKAEDVNMIFHFPVDPIALGIPHYFDVIAREDARDLSTIKAKLDKGGYQTAEQVHRDVRLMFSNAYKFNGRDSPVSSVAAALEASWNRLYNRARAAAEGNSNKKPRLA